MIYVTIPFVFLVNIRKNNGSNLIFLLLIIIWSLDIFSFFFGVSIGKHPIAPRISPKKTWEGTIFGILFSFLIGLIGFYLLKYTLTLSIILMTLFLPIIGFWGDLFESTIKRSAQKKDSGDFLLGHGGFLDRFDSLLFASVAFGILVRFL